MDENTESAPEKGYLNLCDIVVNATVWRIKKGLPFSDNEADLLLHISSEDTDRILSELDDGEVIKFSGILRDRQEAVAARFKQACRYGG